MTDALDIYDAAIAGAAGGATDDGMMIRFADDSVHEMAVRDWCQDRVSGDTAMLDLCTAATIDIGCGPGRLVARLIARGLPALGIDVSAESMRQTHARGGLALRRDVFGRVPAEKRWRHALLADGNIGIGGNPMMLLNRCRELIAGDGTIIVELLGPKFVSRQGAARLESGEQSSDWFPWAHLSVADIGPLAASCALEIVEVHQAAGRWFAELRAKQA